MNALTLLCSSVILIVVIWLMVIMIKEDLHPRRPPDSQPPLDKNQAAKYYAYMYYLHGSDFLHDHSITHTQYKPK